LSLLASPHSAVLPCNPTHISKSTWCSNCWAYGGIPKMKSGWLQLPHLLVWHSACSSLLTQFPHIHLGSFKIILLLSLAPCIFCSSLVVLFFKKILLPKFLFSYICMKKLRRN
jgi:hypothetical protein